RVVLDTLGWTFGSVLLHAFFRLPTSDSRNLQFRWPPRIIQVSWLRIALAFRSFPSVFEEEAMSGVDSSLHRRAFLRTTAGGGFTLGGLFGLGLDLRAAQDEARHLKIAGVRAAPRVSPYCARRSGQREHVRARRLRHRGGNAPRPPTPA